MIDDKSLLKVIKSGFQNIEDLDQNSFDFFLFFGEFDNHSLVDVVELFILDDSSFAHKVKKINHKIVQVFKVFFLNVVGKSGKGMGVELLLGN